MITLKTLKKASLQAIFNQVVRHLIKQNTRSDTRTTSWVKNTTLPTCLYRGPNGTKCAAGCLISDREYDPNMDNPNGGMDWGSLKETWRINSTDEQDALILVLQEVHDTSKPERWPTILRNIAREFNLKAPKEITK